ncbi:ShlB/FhaC/HecB family hemolysin secretion/activation protein [Leptolyngbya sp. CCY15150]|uniref:ShlB/FhaC/HecB family hemolysin secretion/activation protein n=1 Tax=Leptolyngbya sp. CCY15150 TaxID=2767772 RepID=UPI00194F74C2|nr:ShlB/FhaC/HecB family hemolysin secretion/activation protein [Leptolyngbya sp. CCY15150]
MTFSVAPQALGQTTLPTDGLPSTDLPDIVDPSLSPPIDLAPLPNPDSPPSPPPAILESPESSETDVPSDPNLPPSQTFNVTTIEVQGNTVLQDEIAALLAPYENQVLTFEDLFEIRSAITQLYVQNGYITSGAFLPNNQDLSDGIVQIQVVEGTLEDIEISGLRRLRTSYIRDRLNRSSEPPLSQTQLEESLQLLQLNPLISRVNADLTVGSAPGRSILRVNLEEAPAFRAGIESNNYQSTSIGSEQISLNISHENLLGLGDRISVGYGLTEGLDNGAISYTVPFNTLDGTIQLSYTTTESRIVTPLFRDLDIRSDAETFSLGVRQPLVKQPSREFALGLNLDMRRSQTFILNDIPFSFSEGPDDGESRITALRFSQDWIERGSSSVLAARSQFSVGLDALGATTNDIGTDGRFFSWLGQFQWVQQVSPRLVVLTRFNAQLTPDSLLPLERFGFGGVDTVRGYPQNQLVTDNGILGSVEARIPVLANSATLQVTPFLDVAHGWNNQTLTPEENTLASVGLGLRWLATRNLVFRLDYGIPLIRIDNTGNSLQENGLYFSARYQPF